MNCTAGHHCLLYEPYTLYPLDPPWGMDPKPDLSSQPSCPSSSNTPAYLSPANAVSLEEYGGGRTKNGAQLLFPVRDTNLLTVCAKSLLHQWELCQRTTTTPHARSGKQGPPGPSPGASALEWRGRKVAFRHSLRSGRTFSDRLHGSLCREGERIPSAIFEASLSR